MAQLLSTNVSGTLAVTQNTTVSGNLIVSGYNVLNEIFQADNLARVTANSGSAQSAVSLNFVNTATVTVSVTSGGTGVANIGFTSLVSGGVTSVGTGIGLTGGPITSTGTISANIASTTGQGVTKLIDSVTSNDAANAATGAAVKTAFDQATLAYGQANTAVTIGGSAYTQANAAYSAANNAANTVRVTANSGTAQSAVSLNFVNTATIRVNVGGGTTGNANVSFDYIGSVISGGSGINTFPVSVNSVSPPVTANGLNFLNSAFILASVSPGTTGNANVTLSLTQNVTLDTLTVTNLQNTSSNIFVRNSRLIASNIGSPTTTLNQQYGTIHIGDAGGSYQYANIGGFAVNQNANGQIYVFDGLNKSNGSAAKSSIYLQVGSSSAAKYVGLDVGNTDGTLYSSHNFNIEYNSDNVGANLIIRGSSSVGSVLFLAANGQSSFNYPVLIQSVNVVPSIASAANTVRVTANSGSAQSAVGLNFNNTATIRVNVGAGSTGNANVSFDYIGSVSVTGGSGINTFPVSANSGSTVTANGLNFLNSTGILVSVSSGTTGNVNVTLNATNIADNVKILSGTTKSSGVSIFSDGKVTEWSHLTNGNFYPLVSETTSSGVFAGNNGNSIYVVGQAQDNVTQYNLTTAWNVATASFAANLSVSAQEATSVDLFFKNDGTTLYVLGDSGNDITYYTLGTPWSVGGTVTLGGAYSVSAQTSAPRGMHISDDGTKMWIVGGIGASTTTNAVFQYTIATPWDLTTASYDNKSLNTTLDTSLQSISLNPSGTKLFLVGNGGTTPAFPTIYEYSLAIANDVTTSAFTERIKDVGRRAGIRAAETVATGMYVAYQNNKMYLVGTATDSIIEYNTNNGLSIDADALYVKGFLSLQDALFVGNDVRVNDSLDVAQQISVGGSATITGSATISGTFTASGTTADLGTSTSNATYSMGSGATLAGRTKNINIGTNGVANSFTNITIGTTAGGLANVVVNANTTTFSNTVNIGNQLVVSGVNILSELGIAENTARVSANSGSTQNGVAINFINTASVLVSVAAGSTGNADVGFSAVSGSTTTAGILQLTDSTTSTSTTTAATPNSVRLAFDQATLAYQAANTADDIAVAAYSQANTGLNKTQVSANSGSIKTNVAVNFVNTASIFVSVTDGTTGNANVGFSLNTTALRTIWVPAQSMVSRTTAGAASGTTESTTNRVMAKTFDFDTATQEFVQFSVRMPKSWNLGTVSFAPYWTAAGTTAGTVAWTLAGMALSDNEAIDTAFGTSQTSSDTWQTADRVHIGPEPATPITIGNAPVAGDIVFFQVSRDVANDTLDRDAKLLGIALFVTVNARDDT